jgi:hypothetical protein
VQPVAVRILHPAPSPASGPLDRQLATARWANAEHLVELFRAVGVADVRVEEGQPDGRTFGERLRGLISDLRDGSGLLVLGSGSIPLATRRDAADLVAVAGSGERCALANNRYSADVVAIGAASALASVPDLPSDNGLPRWLEESGGYEVSDLRSRWRLAIDLDSPLDVLLAAGSTGSTRSTGVETDTRSVVDRIARVRSVAADPRAELVVAGRTSSATLRWLESHTASRTRALVEERGLRASGVAQDRGSARPPRSLLGLLLDDRGPESLGSVLGELGDGAIVDSRVLLAHRLGRDEAAWPLADDRYASDLLLADQIGDPWLRALTVSARDAAIPLLLGGHTLVGPGVRLLLGRRR